MLGKRIEDPMRIESELGSVPGIGLVDTVTRFLRYSKTTRQVVARVASCEVLRDMEGHTLAAYEIRMGEVSVGEEPPLFSQIRVAGRNLGPEGVAHRNLLGTTCHGIFEDDLFRRAWVNHVRGLKGLGALPPRPTLLEEEIDRLARAVKRNVRVDRILEWALEPEMAV